MINKLLHFGYDPQCPQSGLEDNVTESLDVRQDYNGYDELVDAGISRLQTAFDAEIRSIDDSKVHVVPLSAGLDSRTILAHLVNDSSVDDTQIRTVTFGTPGTWDFELGQRVAKSVEIDNLTVDLTSEEFDWSKEALLNYAKTLCCPSSVFDGYVNSLVLEHAPKNSVIWSGFMGDPSAGGHQPTTPRTSWDEACKYFVKKEQKSQTLTSPDYSPLADIPQTPLCPRDYLTYEEQLDFAIRQQCGVYPVVTHSAAHYRTPFMKKEWLSFILNVKSEYRTGRKLYLDMMLKEFPGIFSIPSDYSYGRPITSGRMTKYLGALHYKIALKLNSILSDNVINPSINYVDFAKQFRSSSELSHTAKNLVESFESRNIAPWLSPTNIWLDHQSGSNRSRDIMIICSIEAFCQTHPINKLTLNK